MSRKMIYLTILTAFVTALSACGGKGGGGASTPRRTTSPGAVDNGQGDVTNHDETDTPDTNNADNLISLDLY